MKTTVRQKDIEAPALSPGWCMARTLALVLGVLAVLLLLPGHLAISGHEVDVLHAVEAAFRLAQGQAQHVDFLTPLGVMAFWPIAFFVRLGLDIATANIAANLTIAALFAPLLLWTGISRLSGSAGRIFAALTLVMLCAVVYGGGQATVSMSMHYNRWGWAAVFIIALMLLVPPRGRPAPALDGAVIGLCFAFLLLLKVTFVVALAPAVALILLLDRDWARLGSGVAAGGTALLLATLVFGGLEFWRHYLLDLLFVASSEVRPNPGKSLTETLTMPQFFPGTICLLAAIVGLRRAGAYRDGLALFLLAPGFAYITYQNWGNDVKWLLPLGFACLVWSRVHGAGAIHGIAASTYFLVLGMICFALITPSFVNMASSPIRNLLAKDAAYVSVLPDPAHDGLIIERKRSYRVDANIAITGIEDPDPPQAEPGDEEMPATLRLGNFDIPRCTLKTGYFGMMQHIAGDLVAAGYGQSALAFVDVANPLPLLGPIPRLEYAAPWYYGGTREADQADYLVVPKCPVSQVTFGTYLDALNDEGSSWALRETRDHVWIFSRSQ